MAGHVAIDRAARDCRNAGIPDPTTVAESLP